MSMMRRKEQAKRTYYFVKELAASSFAAWRYHRVRMQYLLDKGMSIEQARLIAHNEVVRTVKHGADAF